MLYPVFGDKSVETLFVGWKGKDMLSWHRFTNEEKYVLEFYATYYIITKESVSFKASDEKIKYRLPLPRDINDFICDMNRFGIQLYWTEWIDNNFEPKDYLDKNDIEKYYNDLLIKMGKINEIN